jgi:RNA polymerase sigma-70 factor (ECF subfamily)
MHWPSPGSPAAAERTSEELACAAQGGSREAFAALVRRYEKPVFNFLLMRGAPSHDAEELTQETFLRAWQKLDHYRPRWRFSAWLFTMARRLAASRYRMRGIPCSVGRDVDLPGSEQEPVRDLSLREERDHLWAVAARVLSADQRSALWLRYAEEMPVEEVARVLGKLSVTVRVLLFRAREKLAVHLEPMENQVGHPARLPPLESVPGTTRAR